MIYLLFTSAFGITGAALFADVLLLEDGAGLAFLLFATVVQLALLDDIETKMQKRKKI